METIDVEEAGRKIMDFCEKGNVTELKAFLNERGVVEAAEAYRRSSDEWTVLQKAAYNAQDECILVLLDKVPSLSLATITDFVDKESGIRYFFAAKPTALHLAANGGHIKCIMALLSKAPVQASTLCKMYDSNFPFDDAQQKHPMQALLLLAFVRQEVLCSDDLEHTKFLKNHPKLSDDKAFGSLVGPVLKRRLKAPLVSMPDVVQTLWQGSLLPTQTDPKHYLPVYKWMAQEMASWDTSTMKDVVLTVCAHSYILARKNPKVAEECYLMIKTRSEQLQKDMAVKVQKRAIDLGLTTPFARTKATRKTQRDELPFLSSGYEPKIETILESCNFEKKKKIATIALGNYRANEEHRQNLMKMPTVFPVPTVQDVQLACLCITSHYVWSILHSGSTAVGKMLQHPQTRWPQPKTILRMEVKLEQDYKDKDSVGNLLDTVRLSFSGDTVADVLKYTKPIGMTRAMSTEVDAVCSCGMDGCLDCMLGNEADEKPKDEEGSQEDSVELLRCKSTHADETSPVKQEIWNLEYTSTETFGDMVGGLSEENKPHYDVYGDFDTLNIDDIGGDRNPQLFTTCYTAHNKAFKKALSAAKEQNRNTSPYTWAAAVRVLGSQDLADKPIKMIIELQLYLEEMLKMRKTIHTPYTVSRSDTLAGLAQDQRKYALNPFLAYNKEDLLETLTMCTDPKFKVVYPSSMLS
eukprot:m.12389 g.12389  ORF g.12389 m.12389 type:complete len:693 (-) comp4647_c0_seq2:141-2219(-)